MKRPDNLIYGLNEKPPMLVLILLGLQHIFVMSSTLILPVIIVKEIGGSLLQIRAVVSLSMIAAGVGTIIQALRFGPIGSGYLVPNLCGPSYLSVSLQAAWIGGLSLMHGMTIVAGIFETLFSRILNKIEFLFPAEITGLVILMVAITLIPLGTSKFIGINYNGDMPQLNSVIVAVITLGTMVSINIWSRGKLRLYCVLIGMLVGYICSAIAKSI